MRPFKERGRKKRCMSRREMREGKNPRAEKKEKRDAPSPYAQRKIVEGLRYAERRTVVTLLLDDKERARW